MWTAISTAPLERPTGFPDCRPFNLRPPASFPMSANCVSMDVKVPGDLIYVLGETRDELGGSEYYDLLGQVGLNVPRLKETRKKPIMPALQRAMEAGSDFGSPRGLSGRPGDPFGPHGPGRRFGCGNGSGQDPCCLIPADRTSSYFPNPAAG